MWTLYYSGTAVCDENSRLPTEYNRSLQTNCIQTSIPAIRNPIPKPRESMHTLGNPDIRSSLTSVSFRAMAAPYMSPFPNIPLPTGSSSSTASLPSTVLQYPTALYPFQNTASNELKQLTLAQYHNFTTPPGFPTDLSKVKSPFINRNYLELAMLVCNTFRGKLFPCPHCRYVTDRRNNLKRHISTMHQACEKVLECCGVNFTTKASLREHIMIFHHNGYSCAFCGRRFCRKALLKRHLSVHSGQKDYSCPHCDYATSHKSNLERHKRIHERLRGDDEDGENSQSYIDVEHINDNVSESEDTDNIRKTPEPLSLTKDDIIDERSARGSRNDFHQNVTVDIREDRIDVKI
ncbi:unnamed protein product [Mytilus coruscus]|uniref:C2H2-type domain-containing protein n=1 Tax=Mytilus coruscus TaxID=42192 RepID=A0A6J8EEI4_MYTCO|nr:unnamed protein product [Mytilus coruscus]